MTASYIPPYTSAGELVKFINSLTKSKPDPLTVKALQDIGISESNSYTLKGSLVGMGIYDDDGKLLQREDLIGLASKDEGIQRDTFRRILKRTYSELIKAISIEESTVAKVQNHFELKGAATTPALKGARLFIWLARQAGYKTADTSFVPSSVEQEKPQKQKEVPANKPRSRSIRVKPAYEMDFALPITPKMGNQDSDYEEIYLNILLEKIRSNDGLPSEAVMQEVSKLIKAQKEKNKNPESEPDKGADEA